MDSELVKECVSEGVHKFTAGSRNTLSRNQQLLKTISFSAHAIVDRGMTWREIHSVSLKKRVKMWWLVRLRLMGVQTSQILIMLLFFIEVVSENVPYKTGPQRKEKHVVLKFCVSWRIF